MDDIQWKTIEFWVANESDPGLDGPEWHEIGGETIFPLPEGTYLISILGEQQGKPIRVLRAIFADVIQGSDYLREHPDSDMRKIIMEDGAVVGITATGIARPIPPHIPLQLVPANCGTLHIDLATSIWDSTQHSEPSLTDTTGEDFLDVLRQHLTPAGGPGEAFVGCRLAVGRVYDEQTGLWRETLLIEDSSPHLGVVTSRPLAAKPGNPATVARVYGHLVRYLSGKDIPAWMNELYVAIVSMLLAERDNRPDVLAPAQELYSRAARQWQQVYMEGVDGPEPPNLVRQLPRSIWGLE